MKLYKTILLDADGVIASFTQGVLDQLAPIKKIDINDVIERSSWKLEEMWDMTPKEWWDAIDENPNFWKELPMIPWAKQLYNRLHDYADEVVIMTAPPQNEISVSQKIWWLKKHLGVNSNDVMIGKKKYLLARSDTLLIDDAPHNVDPFIKAGGNAVLVPSDWNTYDLNFEKVWEPIEKHFRNENVVDNFL